MTDGRPEELLLRREPGQVVHDRPVSGASRSLRNFIDHWPLDAVFGTQRVGPAVPAHTTTVGRDPVQAAWNRRRKLRCNQGQKLRLLSLCLPEVFVAVEPQEPRENAAAVPGAVEEH